ncbi:MAG: polynucleotide adenylyltransferase, partial [Sphingomonas hengshuiensis]
MSGVTLPEAPWRSRARLTALCDALGAAAGDARFVGGIVRDTLIGIAAHDIDIATRLPPTDVMARLRAAGIKAVPTGIAHGTITAVLPDGPVEVTTLRRDVTTDGRHATIAYTDDWREDAARRDFTINALYADPVSGTVFDYFGGLSDLTARHVRFIGDPLKRIAEDHLRILRFFRFLARFGDAPDADGLAACAMRANDLMALSRERIADELLKLFVTDRAPDIAALMIAHGIFAPVLPEVTSANRLGH